MRRALAVALVCCIGAGPAAAKALHIYSSLPLQGASAAQTRDAVRGIRLALDQAGGKAGAFDILYRSLDDSTAVAGNWDPLECDRNGRRAGRDPATILYIGEFNSGCSAISIPVLNRKNIPQISPSNTYNGLTTAEPG